VTARAPRLIAGAAVLLILIGLGVVLIPPYATNWKLQSYVNALADDASTSKRTEESVRAQVISEAMVLRLPVSGDDVHVAISQGTVKIDVLYIVQVNVLGYAIDLHFRPAAGS
jgi:Domain of unknown function (DUF4845)